MRRALLAAALLTAGCGHATSPPPTTTPAPPGVRRAGLIGDVPLAPTQEIIGLPSQPRTAGAPIWIGAEVPAVQAGIQLLGHETGVQLRRPDGTYGEPTLIAFSSLQRTFLLNVDGTRSTTETEYFNVPTTEVPRSQSFRLAVRYTGNYQGGMGPGTTTARFLSTDTLTQGSWVGKYGGEGYQLAGSVTKPPTGAQVTVTGQSNYTWASSSTELRALQVPGGTDRIAACWYSTTSLAFDVALTDGKAHKITLQALDWEASARFERVEVVDVASGAVLDTQVVSSFATGVYLQWLVSGHVSLRVTNLGAQNAVVSALFVDDAGGLVPAAPPPVRVDSAWVQVEEDILFEPDVSGDLTKGLYRLGGNASQGGVFIMVDPPPTPTRGRIIGQ